jgi:hypothetical protein
MLDAIVLANLIYEMPTSNHKNIAKAFDEFYEERFPTPRRELNPTQQATHVMSGRVRTLLHGTSYTDQLHCSRNSELKRKTQND